MFKFKFWKSEIPNSIFYLTIVAVVFNFLRIFIWGKISFIYILWNLLLALIPFLISFCLYALREKKINLFFLVISLFFWILFLPNAPYLITDLIHLGESKKVPILFDTLLLFSSAVLGLVFYLHSLKHVEIVLSKFFSQKFIKIFILVTIFLTSFGIYLGRFLRFNSWDLFLNHNSLFGHTLKIFTQMATHFDVYMFTLLFSFFLFFTYLAWQDSFKSYQK